MIQGKRICPLTRCVYFLECPQIRDFTAFVSFPFFCAWPTISAAFLERLLYLPLSFRKQFSLSDMVDSEWNGAGDISYYFRGQSSSLATRLHTQFHYIYEIPNTCLLLLNHSEMKSRKSWELVTPPVPSNPPTLLQLSSSSSRGIRKNFYLYPLINSCFFIFFWN